MGNSLCLCRALSIYEFKSDRLLGLHGDRRWMLVDADNGRFITQRLLPQMSQLSALYDGNRSMNPVLADGFFQEAEAEAGEQFHGSSAS